MSIFSDKRADKELEEIEHILRDINRTLQSILKAITITTKVVTSFKIQRIGDTSMDINPGQTTTLIAVPLDATGKPVTLPAGDIPNWSVSDASQITASPDTTGLILTVVVLPTATVGNVIVFTITDAQVPTATGSFSLTITAPTTPNPVASFSITGSAPR